MFVCVVKVSINGDLDTPCVTTSHWDGKLSILSFMYESSSKTRVKL